VLIRPVAPTGSLRCQWAIEKRSDFGSKGIMRACLETQKLAQLEARMDEIADRVAHERTGAARERTQHP
jgi:hypothetical protein